MIKAATIYFSELDDFGKGVDIKSILKKYAMFFEGKFTVNQIINALHIHCERNSVIPKVVHINDILDPVKPKITQSEFIHAKEQWKIEGYPSYSYYAGIVKDYEKQEGNSRNVEPVAEVPLSQLISDLAKKLESSA